MLNAYGRPFMLESFEVGVVAQGLSRVSFARNATPEGSYNEAWLQNLIAKHPELLPIEALEPSLRDAKSICTEMPTQAGYVDNLFVTDRGDFILVECKLWRNPEARREVVGQILDYAKELSRWDYERLEVAIKRALPAPGIDKSASLFARAGSSDGLDEAAFIDAVSRNLRRGRFLLLIVGDGIQEGVLSMTEFLQEHAALHFTLGIVELAIFTLPNGGGHVVQPRILAKTEMIGRGVIELSDERMQPRLSEVVVKPITKDKGDAAPLPKTISEELFFEALEKRQAGSAGAFKALLTRLNELGVTTEALPSSIKLIARINDWVLPLGTIDPKDGSIWFDSVVSRANALGRRDAAMEYYRSLANLIEDESIRTAKLKPNSKTGVASLPLSALLQKTNNWVGAIDGYLRAIAKPVEISDMTVETIS